VQADDRRSILNLYRRVLAARRASPALTEGDFAFLPAPDGVIAFARSTNADRRVVVVNFTDGTVEVSLEAGPLRIEVASDGAGEGDDYAGVVPPSGALILR
jgi:alpha-glucosidase